MGFTPSVCPYCSCGCGMLLETRGGRLSGTHPAVHHPASRGSLCMRGWNAAMAPGHRDRIPAPLVREQGRLVPASAARAAGAVADAMRRLRGRADASVLFCLGPACANEDAYAVRKLAHELGARACPTDLTGLPAARRAIRGVFGRSYLPGGLDALAGADLIWVFGADPKACPQVASRMSGAMRRGAAAVHFDLFAAAGDDAHRTHVFIPPDRFALLPPVLVAPPLPLLPPISVCPPPPEPPVASPGADSAHPPRAARATDPTANSLSFMGRVLLPVSLPDDAWHIFAGLADLSHIWSQA